MTRCANCGRPYATDADDALWEEHAPMGDIPPGWPDASGTHLCWSKWGGDACPRQSSKTAYDVGVKDATEEIVAGLRYAARKGMLDGGRGRDVAEWLADAIESGSVARWAKEADR